MDKKSKLFRLNKTRENTRRITFPGKKESDGQIVLDEPKIKWYRRRLYWTLQERIAYDLTTLVVLAVLVYILFRFVIGVAYVNGDSMYPTLQDHQAVVYNRIYHSYQVGDIVSVRMPSGRFYVKRIVALPGDKVDIRDGLLYVNGEEKEESYVTGKTQEEEGTVEYPLVVEKGTCFILGDNREESNDSRAFGPVIEARITGKVMFYMGTPK